jgi:hypothetical protein
MAKPTEHIDWTDGAVGKVLEPSTAKKLEGFVAAEQPDARHHNWLWYKLDLWIKYLESVTDSIAGFTAVYSAFVGSSAIATHATLAAALADPLVLNGSRILILESDSIDTEIQITKNDIIIEFLPGVIYDKGGSFTDDACISVVGDRCEIHGGIIEGFIGGAETGIIFEAGANEGLIMRTRFNNNTKNIDDLSTTLSQVAVMKK